MPSGKNHFLERLWRQKHTGLPCLTWSPMSVLLALPHHTTPLSLECKDSVMVQSGTGHRHTAGIHSKSAYVIHGHDASEDTWRPYKDWPGLPILFFLNWLVAWLPVCFPCPSFNNCHVQECLERNENMTHESQESHGIFLMGKREILDSSWVGRELELNGHSMYSHKLPGRNQQIP